MHALKHRWGQLSLQYKVILLCGVFLLPMLILIGILIAQFASYRLQISTMLSEYAACISYSATFKEEQEQFRQLSYAVLDQETLIAYRDACKITDQSWEQLRHNQSTNNEQSIMMKQTIDRIMRNYRERQSLFQQDLWDQQINGETYLALQEQSKYISHYIDELTEILLLSGRDEYIQLGQTMATQNLWFAITLAIGGLVFAVGVVLLVRSFILPIKQLSSATRNVAQGAYDTEDFVYVQSDEIGLLSASFNHMKHQISKTIHALEAEARLEKNLRQQEKEAGRLRQLVEESRFAQLQSQINPHFLFNTLQSVASMADMEHATVTSDMVLRLAKFFRYTLETEERIVTLERELDLLRDYISLQELRFGERIAFEMECDSSCADLYLPKFILQPLVENSIVHGMRSRAAGGRIRITAYQYRGACIIYVTDNGSGFDREKVLSQTPNNPKRSIGMKNIAARIELAGGSFRLFSQPAVGTTARICLPFNKETNYDQNFDSRG